MVVGKPAGRGPGCNVYCKAPVSFMTAGGGDCIIARVEGLVHKTWRHGLDFVLLYIILYKDVVSLDGISHASLHFVL